MKLNLGKTPEQQAAEAAKKQRELEAAIQQSVMERQKKLVALHNKQKRNKFIIGTIITLLVIVLIVFGTYNTFFKKGLSMDDVNVSIHQTLNPYKFPAEGLDNYIRDNSQALFNRYALMDNTEYESAVIDKNSVYIFKIRRMTSTLAQVYFSADVSVKEADKVVTDPTIIEKLKKNGFGIKEEVEADEQVQEEVQQPTTTETEGQADEPTEEETESTEETETNVEEQNDETTASESTEATESTEDENSDENANEENSEETSNTEQSQQTSTQPTVEEEEPKDEGFANTNVSMAIDRYSEAIEYYMLSNGTIMQKGRTSTQRYNFYIPIELYYEYDGDTPVTSGYRAAGEMNLYSLNETDQTDFGEIKVHDVFAFVEEFRIDDESSNAAQIKVDKTLADLYSKRDTSQDFMNYRTFNTYDATYIGIDAFEMYSQPNQLGYNAKVTYTIETEQGFKYTLIEYLIVEQSGSSWIIKGIM